MTSIINRSVREQLGHSLTISLCRKEDMLPTCLHYSRLLDCMNALTGARMGELREKYGNYTYKQWLPVIAGL